MPVSQRCTQLWLPTLIFCPLIAIGKLIVVVCRAIIMRLKNGVEVASRLVHYRQLNLLPALIVLVAQPYRCSTILLTVAAACIIAFAGARCVRIVGIADQVLHPGLNIPPVYLRLIT